MTQRRAKYNAQKRVIDGIAFDSKREAGRYNVLRLLQMAGEISNLEIQPEFVLQADFIDAQGKKHRAIKYRADFRYFDHARGKQIVEDVKGMRTQVYRIKKKSCCLLSTVTLSLERWSNDLSTLRPRNAIYS